MCGLNSQPWSQELHAVPLSQPGAPIPNDFKRKTQLHKDKIPYLI